MTDKNENLKSIQTRQCLIEALLILLQRKQLQEISISELCAKAGVSRMGFYRNYNYKEDILKDHLDSLFGHFVDELTKQNLSTLKELSLSFFEHFQTHRSFIETLIRSNNHPMLLDAFGQYLIELNNTLLEKRDTESWEYKNQFIAGGLYQSLIYWIRQDCMPDAETMSITMDRILKSD